jgi:hypothetical protein
MASSSYDFVRGTFHFFVVFGRRPWSVLWLVLWQAIAYTAVIAAIFTALWPLFAILISAAQAGREPTEAEMLAVLGSAWLAVSLSYLATFVVVLMMQGAWLRLLTHGRTAAIIPFRFGFDELRLLGVNLLFALFIFVGYIVSAVVIGLVIGVGALGLELDSVTTGAASGALAVLLVIVFALIAIFLMLRFAAAPAMSVNEGRFRLFGSFAATKGVWGWMLLSYLLLYVLFIAAATFVSGIQFGAILIGAADVISILEAVNGEPDMAAVFEMLRSPSVIAAFVIAVGLQFLLQSFMEGSWHGVGAYAALRHAGKGEAEEAVETAPPASVGEAPSQG